MKPKHLFKTPCWPALFKPLGLALLFLLVFAGSAVAQSMTVKGLVTDEKGDPLVGVSILVTGSAVGTITELDGTYELKAEKGASLQFSYTGYMSQTAVVGDNARINITLQPDVAILDEVVVTGYSTQRKRDITGAVSTVSSEDLNQVVATSFTQKLEGRAAGVTVSTSGEPGEGAVIRIRGISSFQNNDPLYVIDGVPVEDSYSTGFNPNDIESIQVLKDASAASIYGSRANNGVIIVTTKKGKAGRTTVTYDAYVGIQSPIAKIDYLITDPNDYSDYIWTKHENAGLVVDAANPYGLGRGILPTYSFPAGNNADEADYSYPDNIIVRANQEGTNWFEQVFSPSVVTEHNLGVAGGNENARYYFSTSYTDNKGTMLNNYFKRFSLRANSEFNAGRFTFGENISLSRINSVGQDGVSGGNQDEQGIMTWLTIMNPLTPVRDVGGNYAGDKAPGMSNGSNPVAQLDRAKDNEGTYYRILGNGYADVRLFEGLKFRTSLGMEFYNNYNGAFSFPTFENREVSASNGWNEAWANGFTWTWTNTLTYNLTFATNHSLQVLVGYEAIKSKFRNMSGSLANYFTDNINAWYLNSGLADPGSRVVSSSGGEGALASAFAKVDYSFADKYLISATIRRDGSSNFGDEKYGVFPAFSAGWRVSGESFMEDVDWISDLKLRFGWGITGNQRVPAGNAFDRFGGGPSSTFYDINGANNSVATGYALSNRGNSKTKWEENISTNFGVDLSLWQGKINFVADIYDRTIDGLLFPAANPGTAGTAAPAFVNIGKMNNKGVDLGLDYRNRVNGDLSVNFGVTFSHYKNEIVQIDGNSTSFFPAGFDSRIGTVGINKLGYSISSFYGYTADGLFRSDAEVDAHAEQDGAAVGRIRFKDIDGFNEDGELTGIPDGIINDADKGVIGDPHPDFIAGLTLGFTFKRLDFSAFFFGSVGNQVFNYNKVFDVFGLFNSNVRKELLTDAFSPTNPDGDLPMLDVGDTFSQQPNSFYVEDASYLRLKTLQLGYTFPGRPGVFNNLRVYIQAQNLFTLTGYSGLDPAPSNFGVQDGLNGDQWNGYDFGNYPANKIFMFGVNASF